MSDKLSLDQFAVKNKQRKRKCATCNLPSDVLEQVNEGLRNGIGHKTISNWLEGELGIFTNPTNYHFQARHHLENL